MSGVVALEGTARHYDWGSPTVIPQLLGVPPDGRPVAELWFGAHPGGPAAVPARAVRLDQLVAADPAGILGPAVADRFGGRLPFLVKILAAEHGLSIQVHPDGRQAREGFAREEAAGIPRDAANRNYRDPNHKPELICALTPIEALCGFRPAANVAALLDALDTPALAGVRAALDGEDPLRAAFTEILRRTDPGATVSELLDRLPALRDVDAGAARAVELTAADRPGDPGIVLTLLLNYTVLEPGEALFLRAGNVHAYLRGCGVEVMASSDNVLRCGLTSKHVDVDELLRITDFRALPDLRSPADPLADGIAFRPPVDEFALTRLSGRAAGSALGRGPAIVLCTAGTTTVDGIELRPGRAVFVPFDAAEPGLSGTGTVFVARPGLASPQT
jgi:mannose-6-phosphate isomerase